MAVEQEETKAVIQILGHTVSWKCRFKGGSLLSFLAGGKVCVQLMGTVTNQHHVWMLILVLLICWCDNVEDSQVEGQGVMSPESRGMAVGVPVPGDFSGISTIRRRSCRRWEGSALAQGLLSLQILSKSLRNGMGKAGITPTCCLHQAPQGIMMLRRKHGLKSLKEKATGDARFGFCTCLPLRR